METHRPENDASVKKKKFNLKIKKEAVVK